MFLPAWKWSCKQSHTFLISFSYIFGDWTQAISYEIPKKYTRNLPRMVQTWIHKERNHQWEFSFVCYNLLSILSKKIKKQKLKIRLKRTFLSYFCSWYSFKLEFSWIVLNCRRWRLNKMNANVFFQWSKRFRLIRWFDLGMRQSC